MPNSINRTYLEKLLVALTEGERQRQLFSWWGKVEKSKSLALEALYIKKVGAIRIPFSKEDLKAVKKNMFVQQNNGADGNKKSIYCTQDIQNEIFQIESNQIILIPSKYDETQDELLTRMMYNILTSLLETDLKFINVNVAAELEKLVVCEAGQTYCGMLNLEKAPGMFGTALVQVPVKADHSSGILTIIDGTKKVRLDFLQNTDESQLIVAMFGKSSCNKKNSFMIESYPDGIVAVMVFNLVWVDHSTLGYNIQPEDLPELLLYAQLVSQTLEAWNAINSWQRDQECPHDSSNDCANESETDDPEKNSWEEGSTFSFFEEETGSEILDVNNTPLEDDVLLDAEQTKFLCFPLTCGISDKAAKLALWNLEGGDLMIAQLLSFISFIDLSCAYIKVDRSWFIRNSLQPELMILNPDWIISKDYKFLRFEKGFLEKNNLRDDIFLHPFDVRKHLIGLCNPDFSKTNEDYVYFPVLVARSRNVELLVSEESPPFKSPYTLLLQNLEDRYGSHLKISFASNYKLRKLFIKDLDYLIDVIENSNEEYLQSYAPPRFLSRLLNICFCLDATQQGLRILEFVSNSSFLSNCFFCDENNLDEIAPTIANFICVKPSWNSCSESILRMIREDAEMKLGCFFDIAIQLYFRGCLIGTRQMFDELTSVLRKSSNDSLKEKHAIFGIKIVELAIYLRKEDKTFHGEMFHQAISFMKTAEPSTLTKVVRHLGNMITSEQYDCRFCLTDVSRIIVGTNFTHFKPGQFLQILSVFNSLNRQETMKALWNNLCSQCIRIWESSGLLEHCLFCKVMHDKESREERHYLLPTLARASIGKETLMCSVKTFTNKQITLFDVEEIVEYIQTVSWLQEVPELSDMERVEEFCKLFSHLSPDCICHLAVFFAQSKYYTFQRESSATNQILDRLYRKIAAFDLLTPATPPYYFFENIFLLLSWFGDYELMRSVMEKLDRDAVPGSKFTDALYLVSLFSTTLKAADGLGENSAVSLLFNRRIFNLISRKWLETLRNLDDRSASFSDCCQLVFTSEKNFNDSTETDVIAEFNRTVEILTFHEIAEVLHEVFKSEVKDDEELTLDQYTICWSLFSKLCKTLLKKLDIKQMELLQDEKIVSLMQSYWWIRDDKSTALFSRAVCVISSSSFSSNVNEAIIFHKNSIKLASQSSNGILSLNDLIDTRIQNLNKYLMHQLNLRKIPSSTAWRSTCPQTTVDETQAKIASLLDMRRELLTLLGQQSRQPSPILDANS